MDRCGRSPRKSRLASAAVKPLSAYLPLADPDPDDPASSTSASAPVLCTADLEALARGGGLFAREEQHLRDQWPIAHVAAFSVTDMGKSRVSANAEEP